MRKSALIISVSCFIGLSFLTALSMAANKSGVEPQVISLPDGPGSIAGLGESFEPNLNSGTAPFKMKIEVCPGITGFQPEVTLSYDSGYGNGIMGLGWQLNIPYIQRQTDKGLPRYDESDNYIHSDYGELILVENNMFRLKIEKSFSQFIKSDIAWEVRSKNGTKHFFGETDSSVISNPDGTFRWMLERSLDHNGNKIAYHYFQHEGNVYLQEIQYGFVSETDYKRKIFFDYETREDVIEDYRSRYKVSTVKRLKSISVLSEGNLVRKYDLSYEQSPGTALSLLKSITQLGKYSSTLLSITFQYTEITDPSQAQIISMENPPPVSLDSADADLVDINGDGLPDVFHTPYTDHEFYMNMGNGVWSPDSSKPLSPPAYRISDNGVMMADFNGDGHSDLVIKVLNKFCFFNNTGEPWEDEVLQRIDYTRQPNVDLEDPDTRLVELNNDGFTDIIYSGQLEFYVYLNDRENPWEDREEASSHGISFSDNYIRFADMNGDRLQDVVRLDPRAGKTYYLPGSGYGNFEDAVNMIDSPDLPYDVIEEGNIFLMDANSDGLSDLVRVMSGMVFLWLNKGNNQFSSVYEISGTPSFKFSSPTLRQADMDGDGCRDLLISMSNVSATERYQYIDFSQGTHPNLLKQIDNGLGMTTDIEYKSSTEYYLEARDAGNPWETEIPFPVQVVSKKIITDKNSKQQYVIEYIYRDGYYDGDEKEFRGFARVDQMEYGDPTFPTLKTHHVFDVGKDRESQKGMLLEQATLKENGTLDPLFGLYQHKKCKLETRNIITETDVWFSFTAQEDIFVYEDTATPKQLCIKYDYDDYGNETENFNYGEITGDNFAAGNDEILTTTEYYYWDTDSRWMMNRPKRIRQTYLDGTFVSDTQNFYDKLGNLEYQQKSPDGTRWIRVVKNEYGPCGNIIKITDANNHFRSIGYDPVFCTFPVSETIHLENSDLAMYADYDYGFGKVKSFTDFNAHKTIFEYDEFGRLIKIVKPGDSDFYTQMFEYNLADPVSHVIARTRENFGKPDTYDSYTYYDGLGRKLQVRSEGENSDQWVVTEAAAFNLRQKEKKKWLPYFAGTSAYQTPDQSKAYTAIEYDPTGRVIRETNPGTSFRTTEYLPLQKQVWDEEDNYTGSSHFDTPHLFTYDGLERLVQVEERNGDETYTTKYGYDGLKNLIWILDDKNNEKNMNFDGMGRKTYMDDPDKGEMSYQYDDAGNLIQTADNKGQVVTYSYDYANRIKTENHNGVRVAYHYDADIPLNRNDLQNTLGRLVYVEDEAGIICFSYDARGNVAFKSRKAGEYEFLLGMEYDATDRITRMIYPDGEFVNYEYNSMNQLYNVSDYIDKINYNASGQKTEFVYANGLESAYEYDIRQRLETLKTFKVSETLKVYLQDLLYAYDKVSNITEITDSRSNPTPESQTRVFTYDDLYRLKKCNATAAGWYIDYNYDSIGNLTGKTSDVPNSKVNLGTLSYGEGSAGPHAVTQAGNFTYTYDANGNIRTKTGYTFTFDYKDRMTAMNRASDGLQATYKYDYEGNRVIKETTKDGRTIYIDKFAEVRGDRFIVHIYAGDRRVARISKPFDAAALITEPDVSDFDDFDTDSNGTISLAEIRAKGDDPQKAELGDVRDALKIYRKYIGDANSPMAFKNIADAVHELGVQGEEGEIETHFYIPDHLGSASVMVDKYGNVVEESVCYPYGMNRKRTGEFEAEYRFTGKELDGESGLHYFGARYYDAMVGRFVSVDPLFISYSFGLNQEEETTSVEILKELNLYCYTINNPIKWIDEWGLLKDYTEEETRKIIEDAVNELEKDGFFRTGYEPLLDVFGIGERSLFGGGGKYDYKINESDSTFIVNGEKLSASDFGNYLPAYATTKTFGKPGELGTKIGGHLFALGEALDLKLEGDSPEYWFDDPGSTKWINKGIEDARKEKPKPLLMEPQVYFLPIP
ncbi:MAG: hypothetical protein GY749_38985 [Desulfobacteraceae bacterium]|nr:hypothetical protein [Desulfobacteraceae bacterium]